MYTTISDAIWAAIRKYPLAVNVILSLHKVRTNQLPCPVGIDKFWRLYYNPELLSRLTPVEAGGAVLCEVGHILYRHGKRGQWLLGENPTPHQAKLWNRAADLALHYGLQLEGVQLPPGLELPADLGYDNGLSAEDYFCLLEDDYPEPQQQGGGKPQQGQGQGQGQGGQGQPGNQPGQGGQGGGNQNGNQDGQNQPQNQGQGNGQGKPTGNQLPPETKTKPPQDRQHKPQQGDDVEDGYGQPQDQNQDQQPQDGNGQGDSQPQEQPQEPEPDPDRPEAQAGGSAADGIPREWELGEDAEFEDSWGDNGRDGLLYSAAQSLERSKGSTPGQAGHWANDIVKTKSDPLAKLRQVITKKVEQFQSGQGDYSYRRPSRRSTGQVLLSGNVAPVPRIAILIDTSGSMRSGDDIGIALGMVNRVIKGLNLTQGVEYYCGDTRLVTRGKVTDAKDIKLGGGGGTSMDLLIAQIAEPQDKRLQPDIVICCTDAETEWPPHRLKVPVIAAVTRGSSYESGYVKRIPRWIDTVVLHASPSERRRLGL